MAPSGPSSGVCDSLYLFTSSAVDPDSDSVALRFDWGDGDTSSWTNFITSGGIAGAEHAWYFVSACSVRAQAKDRQGALSGWSEAKTMPLAPGPRFADSLIARIPVGATPVGIAALPSGEYVYVACSDQKGVWVIRTSDNTVTAVVSTGWQPMGVACTPDGQFVYVTDVFDQTVTIIRTSDNAVVETIPSIPAAGALTVLPDGQFVYVCCDDGTVAVIRTDNHAVVARAPAGSDQVGIVATPDSRCVAVACSGQGWIAIVRTSDHTVLKRVAVGDEPWGLAASPDGNRIFAAVGTDLIHGVSAVQPIRTPDFLLVDSAASLGDMWPPMGMTRSPDGAYLYVLFEQVYPAVMAVVSTRTLQMAGCVSDLGVDVLGPYGATYLPDGTLYVADEDGECVSVFGFSSGSSPNPYFRRSRNGR